MNISRPMVIGSLVPEKKSLKGFTIYWHGGHLGHVTKTIFKNNFWLIYHKESFFEMMSSIGLVASVKNIIQYTDKTST